MSPEPIQPQPFAVADCAMLSIATGVSAQDLRELRQHLVTIPSSSLHFHFWGAHLRPGFEEPEYSNDFANWASQALHDRLLAERLSVIDPPSHGDLEGLRAALIEVLDQRLREAQVLPALGPGSSFHFIRAITLVFDTGMRLRQPAELLTLLPDLSRGSLFYHFIDARRRPPEGMDDFRAWLAGLGPEHESLIAAIADIDPYFITLTRLRESLIRLFEAHLGDLR